MTRGIGLALMVIGIAGLLFGELGYTKRQEDVDFGPLVVKHVERRSIDFPPFAAAAALMAGAILVAASPRGRRRDLGRETQ